jgi:4-hydroxy-2-oxoglutarate aldolase
LCGSASALLGSLKEGASGGILALAACAPQACHEIYLSWKDHDLKLAEDKQNLISPVNKRIVGDLGISGVKHACDFNGYYGGRPRNPLLGLTSVEKAEVEVLLAEMRN